MATFTYDFGNGDRITFTTGDTPIAYRDGNNSSVGTGYNITGATGTFKGQTVTGVLPANNTTANGNPQSTNPAFLTGAGTPRTYDNVLWTDNNPADTPAGSSTNGFAGSAATASGNAASYYGLDRFGIALVTTNAAGTTYYNLYKPTTNATAISYRPATAGNASDTGTDSTFNPAAGTPECFLTGTRIRVLRAGVVADVAVEDLAVGDRALTAAGHSRPVAWIGCRTLDGNGRPLAHDQQPIRVRAGAFGLGLPARTLRVSPGHPVLVGADENGEGGVLVPAMCLINGTTIVRETTATSVTYWHVELDAHDILLAEGLAAESYYDMGTRGWFAGEAGALVDPEFVPAGRYGRCRPVAVDGPLVEAERWRLAAVFAAELAAHSAWSDAVGLWLAA